MKIISGKIHMPQKVVIYGPEGIGKSTFAAAFPDPLFIDTEGSTNRLDVKRMERPESWAMLVQQVDYVLKNPDCCKTLVIDSADWAEKLAINFICQKFKLDGIESMGWGKGYTYLEEEFGRLLNRLQDVIDVGVNVVLTAHSQIKKFERPDELGAYDRWELKLQKKTSPLLKEWADMVLFANYKIIVTNVDNQGAIKGKNKAQGGRRMLYTAHTPAWDAKNREGLEMELPLDFASIAHIFEDRKEVGKETEIKEPYTRAEQKEENKVKENIEETKEETKEEIEVTEVTEEKIEIPLVAHKELNQLLMANDVYPHEVERVVFQKGYYPEGAKIDVYDERFIDGVLVGAWEQVFNAIKENRKNEEENK